MPRKQAKKGRKVVARQAKQNLNIEQYIEQASIQELVEAQNKIEKAIKEKKKNSLKQLLFQFSQEAEKYGASIEEVIEQYKPRKPRTVKPPTMIYQHPTNPGLTWTGRGKMPFWFIDLLEESGKDRGSFLVPNPEFQ